MSQDVRSVANYVLDLAQEKGRKISNFEVNKVVFFLHAHFLVEFERPLVSAKIEAWKHGPVFRELYKEFRRFDDKPIEGRASRLNPETGVREVCAYDLAEDEKCFLEKMASKYLGLSFGALYAAAHETGGPWAQVWNHDTLANPSMKISDEIIRIWFEKAARH
jgi:uncharacterized phage-associated protein